MGAILHTIQKRGRICGRLCAGVFPRFGAPGQSMIIKNVLLGMLGVITGYALFAASTFILFSLPGIDPYKMPNPILLIISAVYGMVFAAVAGYVAVLIAKQVLSAYILAAIMFIIAFLSLVSMWGHGTIWSEIAVIIFMVPSSVLGGIIKSKNNHIQKEMAS